MPDLYVLDGKIKAQWSRGLFISVNGFSEPSAQAYAVGRKANLLTMDGQDLILILEGHWTLENAFRIKMRLTGESNNVHVPLATARRDLY
jgi:hypothetical protein